MAAIRDRTKRASSAQMYTSRLQKGGGLVPEMRRLVLLWSDRSDAADRIVAENALSAPSRTRARDVITRAFVPRFVRSNPPALWRAVATLERGGWSSSALLPVHYYATAAAEPLLWDFVADVLFDRVATGRSEIRIADVERFLRASPPERFIGHQWSPAVTTRVARGLLSALRDFGILQGAVRKQVRPLYVPTESFAFLARVRHELGKRGVAQLHDPCWQLFFLTDVAVERFFTEAHQRKLLAYHAAGSTIRIEYPKPTLEEYAHELVERAR
jgi:hypothetical protein